MRARTALSRCRAVESFSTCAIVFAVMLIPVCKLGTLEPRGDLLQHMDDPPQLGASPLDLP
jgi:hypothetical protein